MQKNPDIQINVNVFVQQLMKWVYLCYHLLVKSEGGDAVDHVDVPSVSHCSGFFGRRDCPLPAPEVRGYTES